MGVALRKESVDRNTQKRHPLTKHKESLSARRAWIEIVLRSAYYSPSPVALRKESVDRNELSMEYPVTGVRRSPQGERG